MFRKALILMIVLEAGSLLAFKFNALSLPFLLALGIGTFIISLKRLEWGIYILFGELFVGSRGRLLEHDFISLRMVIFAAVFLAWIINEIRSATADEIRNLNWRYWLVLFAIGLAAAHGWLAGNGTSNVFQDVNGYLYLLILPAVLAGIRNREALSKLFEILKAAILIIASKTLILFLWFSFGLPGVATAYHWVINRDIGEITGMVGSASRIFMQSQFWALVGLFVFLFSKEKKDWVVIAAAVLCIIMSLSRSFWLGGVAAAGFVVLFWFLYERASFTRLLRLGATVVLIAVVEIGILYGITLFGGAGLSESVASRTANPASEAAGGARLLLLPELLQEIKDAPLIGKGFGEEVVYKSYLPDRVTPDNPDGEITSFAFEWAYLDMWLKLGAAGFLIYLLFIASVFRMGWEKLQISDTRFQTLGILSGLAALVVLNVTTPYLNHPLGIGYLVLSYLSFQTDFDEPSIS